MRIGHGYDAHKLIPGTHIILGGIEIESNFSIEASSNVLSLFTKKPDE